ncbi:MAG: NAD(+) diphosphatase [Gammaproteobacteria bacterium]|nr:NAD(+) diphosphatase [Gammaproteobacteria bacterium]
MFAFQFEALNRQGELRHDETTILSFINHDNALFLPIYKQFVASRGTDLMWLTKNQLENKVDELSPIHFIYLGKINQQHFFAYRLSSSDLLRSMTDTQLGETSDGLRNILPHLTAQDAYLANVATALNQWHSSHQHCGYCGHETFAKDSGFVRQCSNTECSAEHFPRTDPAIIVAITHTDTNGVEKILLGRQASWPEKRYSVIAGFVEPGESLEQAVKREAYEEVGLELSQVEYQISQPWPFPQSVMLGFKAQAVTNEIQLKDQELETADWFSKEQIHQLVAQEKLLLPFAYSISRHLIDSWLAKN